MKIMIASDIHGSAKYLDMLLDCYRSEKPDKFVLLGDILYHGPRNDLPEGYNPKEVISKLNAIRENILCVRGNCDTEVDQMVLEFPILADYAFFYYEETMIFITHGHQYNTDNPPMLKKGDVLLHGHTHIPVHKVFGHNIYINPGSVSIPKEDSPHGYMVFTDGEFIWKDLEQKEYDRFKLDRKQTNRKNRRHKQ